jgi:hypothetical protein
MSFIILFITFFGFLLHLLLGKKPKTPARIVELLLLYLLVINIGLGGILAWSGHTFMAAEIAQKIGWQPGSPFQFEVAVANLSYGVCGILSIWGSLGFRTATGMASSIFLLGCAVGHIRQIMEKDNLAIYNAGPILYINDIAIPVLILLLLALAHYFRRRTS